MSPPSDPGRRAQRQRETRVRLERAAQRLFLDQGFEPTTVDEIAAAAGVSRRTFFNYYDTKEAVLFARYASFEQDLADAIRAAPSGAGALTLAEHAISALLDQLDPDEVRAIGRIKRDVPALQERDRGKYERLERTVADALADRVGETRDGLQMRLDAMLITTVLRAALEGWGEAAEAGIPNAVHVERIVRGLRTSVSG